MKINRGAFLRAELRKRFPRIDVKLAVKTTPLEAGVSPSEIDSLALDVIDYETKIVRGNLFSRRASRRGCNGGDHPSRFGSVLSPRYAG